MPRSFAATLLATLALGLGLAPTAQAAPATVAVTAGNDVYTFRVDGTRPLRLTSTSGGDEGYETWVAHHGASTVAYQTRLGAYRYSVVLRRGRKQSLPFAAWQRRRGSARWTSFGAPAFSADGKRLATVCVKGTTRGICLYDLKRRTLKRIVRCACLHDFGLPPRLSWSRDGRWMAFNDGEGSVYRVDVRRKRIAKVFDDQEGNTVAHPTISPDGSRIAFAMELLSTPVEGQPIRVLDVATRAQRDLLPPHGPNDEFGFPSTRGLFRAPSFSPDGRELLVAFHGIAGASVPGFPSGFYAVPVDGGAPRKLLEATYEQLNTAGTSTSWGS